MNDLAFPFSTQILLIKNYPIKCESHKSLTSLAMFPNKGTLSFPFNASLYPLKLPWMVFGIPCALQDLWVRNLVLLEFCNGYYWGVFWNHIKNPRAGAVTAEALVREASVGYPQAQGCRGVLGICNLSIPVSSLRLKQNNVRLHVHRKSNKGRYVKSLTDSR